MNEYEQIKKFIGTGYARFYLEQCHKKSKSDDEMDINIYTKLVQLDSKLGTSATEQLLWCVFYTQRFDLIKVRSQFRALLLNSLKVINMSQVDFDYAPGGFTIYKSCFQPCLYAKLYRVQEELSKIIPKTEAVFEFLVEQGKEFGFNVDSILETRDETGGTCFSVAAQCSEKISNYILQRPIRVNSISMNMMVPDFRWPDLAIKMMEKGINPHIIDHWGLNQIKMFRSSFQSEEAKSLSSQFSRSVHFSIEDIHCENTCPADCPSNFKKFICKEGALVEMIDETRIGSGGFGMVFRGIFHGISMAMKYMYRHETKYFSDNYTELQKNTSELRTQSASAGSGVIVPVAFVRQQNQEQDDNEKWIAHDYNIFIYPLYDCNLYEFHENNNDHFNDVVLRDILNQCLTRKKSNRFEALLTELPFKTGELKKILELS